MVNPPPMTLAQPDPAGLVSGVCDESAVPSASVKVSSIRYAAPTTQPTIVLIHSQMICLHPLPEMVYMLPLGLSCLSLAPCLAQRFAIAGCLAYMYLRCLAERKGMGHLTLTIARRHPSRARLPPLP